MPLTLRISQPFLSARNMKLQVCKHSPNGIVTDHFAEGLMKHFLSEQKGKGLKFALNVKFWI